MVALKDSELKSRLTKQEAIAKSRRRTTQSFALNTFLNDAAAAPKVAVSEKKDESLALTDAVRSAPLALEDKALVRMTSDGHLDIEALTTITAKSTKNEPSL